MKIGISSGITRSPGCAHQQPSLRHCGLVAKVADDQALVTYFQHKTSSTMKHAQAANAFTFKNDNFFTCNSCFNDF